MKHFNQARKYGSRVALVLSPMALATQARAAVPETVTDAIEGVGTDLVTVITAVIVAMLAFWGLRKIASKFGWN